MHTDQSTTIDHSKDLSPDTVPPISDRDLRLNQDPLKRNLALWAGWSIEEWEEYIGSWGLRVTYDEPEHGVVFELLPDQEKDKQEIIKHLSNLIFKEHDTNRYNNQHVLLTSMTVPQAKRFAQRLLMLLEDTPEYDPAHLVYGGNQG